MCGPRSLRLGSAAEGSILQEAMSQTTRQPQVYGLRNSTSTWRMSAAKFESRSGEELLQKMSGELPEDLSLDGISGPYYSEIKDKRASTIKEMEARNVARMWHR